MRHARLRPAALLAILAAISGCQNPSTTPASKVGSGPTFVFTAAGDYGLGSDASVTLEGIAHAGAKFHLALGDLSYGGPHSESAWCDLVKSKVGRDFPVELLAGNHEEDSGEDGHIRNFAACLPDRMNSVGAYAKEYYFDVLGLARFILISPDLTIDGEHYFYGGANKHYTWVANAIDSARAAHIPWIVVGMHKSCLSVGQYYCEIYQELLSLLVERKVDLVIQAHDHTYQRTKQLATGPSCPVVEIDTFNPDCMVQNSQDNVYLKGAGSVSVIAATGGGELYDVNTRDPEAGYFATWMGANSNPRKGFAKFTVSNTELSGDFVGSVATSTFTDHFTIKK